MIFEKISLEQWEKDFPTKNAETKFIVKWYEDLKLPARGTKYSAAYDFFLPYTLKMEPCSSMIIPTGIRWVTDINNRDKVLNLYPRSGLGFKHGIKLSNTVGKIDADYYQAENEGHIMIKLVNPSNEVITIAKGSGFAQGEISTYYTVDNDNADAQRIGGFGSTDK